MCSATAFDWVSAAVRCAILSMVLTLDRRDGGDFLSGTVVERRYTRRSDGWMEMHGLSCLWRNLDFSGFIGIYDVRA